MQISSVDDPETSTAGASGSSTCSNACSKSSDDLLSTVSEGAASGDQLPHEDLLTVSTFDQTPELDISISCESSTSTPESNVSVSGADDHKHMSGSDSDTQFIFSVDALNLPPSWHYKTCSGSVCFYKLVASADQPSNVSLAVNVNDDGTWKVFVHNHALNPSCDAVKVISKSITGLD